MLKNFENGYLVSGSSEIAKTEKNDCAVRAIANACEVNYNQAHKFVNDNFDRKKGKGTEMFIHVLDKVKKMEFDEVGQLDLFGNGITRELKCIGKAPKYGGKLANPKYRHKPVAFTVKEFAQKFKRGNFILTVKGHALAVKNGIIVDNKNYQMGGYRRVVEAAYQVK